MLLGIGRSARTDPNERSKPILVRRDLQFGRSGYTRYWHGGNPVATAFYNTLSATFPDGEHFFVESVKKFRHLANDHLRGSIEDFIYQESLHRREHVVFNDFAKQHGYDVSAIAEITQRELDVARSYPEIAHIAMTVALEHFTAVFAACVLSDPRHLAGASPEAARLWRWHSIEEIEHKAVAFDLYGLAVKGLRPMQRWSIRIRLMLAATSTFSHIVWRGMREELRRERRNPMRIRWDILWFLFGSPGLIRAMAPRYFAFYGPGFHPDNHNDRDIVSQARRAEGYSGEGAPRSPWPGAALPEDRGA